MTRSVCFVAVPFDPFRSFMPWKRRLNGLHGPLRSVTMLNLRRGIREGPESRSLRGRFVPPSSLEVEMKQLNSLQSNDLLSSSSDATARSSEFASHTEEETDEGLYDGGLSAPGNVDNGSKRRWNRRSEAAKKRWADPEYRAKMMNSRQKTKREKASQNKRVEIGPMDSIVGSSDQKSKMIMDYAIANAKRADKIRRFHHQRASWMRERLSGGQDKRDSFNNDDFKLERKQKRSEVARKRQQRRKSEDGETIEEGKKQ